MPANLKVLISAGSSSSFGSFPEAGLIIDDQGYLYGTTSSGGQNTNGTLVGFPSSGLSFTVFQSFLLADGSSPRAALVADSQGNLFGTTINGGSSGLGTVFEYLANGNFETLASFNGANGSVPYSALVEDTIGNLYGTTLAGGAAGDGTVFEIASGSNTITTLVSFKGANGANPLAGLLLDSAGDLFGTTENGGANGDGTVFEVAAGSNVLSTLVTFDGANGAFPTTALSADDAGNIFGSTTRGGAGGYGTVFRLAAGTHNLSEVASFSGANGGAPSNVLIDGAGNLFGTAREGTGSASGGTVFEIAAGTSAVVTLATFGGPSGPAGSVPNGNLVADHSGNLFGTTTQGGNGGEGTVFEVTGTGYVPPAPVQWKAGVVGLWSDASKWVGGYMPMTTDDVVVAVAGNPEITIAAPTIANSLSLDLTGGEVGGVFLKSTLDVGSLILDENDDVTDGTSFGLSGATLNSRTVSLGTGTELYSTAGNSIVNAAIANNGEIDADSNLFINGAITGTGFEAVEGGATLELNGADGQEVDLRGAATIKIDQPLAFTSPIYVDSTSGTIDLPTITSAGFASSGSTLSIELVNGHFLTLQAFDVQNGFSSNYMMPAGYEWLDIPDHLGGSLLSFVAGRALTWQGGEWSYPVDWQGHVVAGPADAVTGGGTIEGSVVAASLHATSNVTLRGTLGLTGDLTLPSIPGGSASLVMNAYSGDVALNAAHVVVGSGNSLAGEGAGGVSTIRAAVQNDGLIDVSQGRLVLNGALSGTGYSEVDVGATLEIAGAVNQTIGVLGGKLVLDDPTHFAGPLYLNGSSFTIDLAGYVADHFDTAGDTLNFTRAGVTTSVPTVLTGNVQFMSYRATSASDGAGGTLITVTHEPPPAVTLTQPGTAEPGQSLVIASATAPLAGSSLSVQLLSDAKIASGSAVSIDAHGLVTYAAAAIDAAGSDSVSFRVTDAATGEFTDTTATFMLGNSVQVPDGPQRVIVNPGTTYVAGSGPDTFVAAAATLSQDTINGGMTNTSVLTVTGGGTAVEGGGITGIHAITFSGGPVNFTANDQPGQIIVTNVGGSDTIHDGNGGDAVYVESARDAIYGGSGGDNIFVTAATIGATIDGGTGQSGLDVQNGGTETMGANITRISNVHLMGGTAGTAGYSFTANATAGLIVVGSRSNDTIAAGDASQTVLTGGQASRVLATAATAGVRVAAVGAGNVATLEIAGGGTARLNAADGSGLQVVLDAATNLSLGTAGFITATALTAGSTLTAQQNYQTLVSTHGGDTLVGYAGGHDTFEGTRAGLTGDVIRGFAGPDALDITDLLPSAGVSFKLDHPGTGTLSFGGGGSLTMTASYDPTKFHIASDGHGGSLVTYG